MEASQKYTILYGRLSDGDDNEGESNSIINQRLLLEDYARKHGFQNVMFLADDDKTGTDFKRPAWDKVEKMIVAGEVETLIVKDLSRMGREYIKMGQYMELEFPSKGIRFIAIYDGVDSMVESTMDFAPMKNFFNEYHAKDTSKKVRTIKRFKANMGERLSGWAPYGYKISEENKKKLEPNEDTAPIVKHIFDLCAAGHGPSQIARILAEENIMTPSYYYFKKYGSKHSTLDTEHPYRWSASSVSDILENVVYLGHSKQLNVSTISFKNKTRVIVPEDQKAFVKNTHQPIITQEQWDIVQNVREHKKRLPKRFDKPSKFAGIVFCKDCDTVMIVYRSHKLKEEQFFLQCGKYNRNKGECTRHGIKEKVLEQIVLDDIRRITWYAREKKNQFAEYVCKKNTAEAQAEIKALQNEIAGMKRRINELKNLFARIYEDNVLGKLNDDQFRMLSIKYNTEQNDLESKLPNRLERLEKLKDSVTNIDNFIEKAKQFQAIDELTPELLRLFIKKIVVGEKAEKYSRTAPQSVTIEYRDIGVIDSAMLEGEIEPQYVFPPRKDNSSLQETA